MMHGGVKMSSSVLIFGAGNIGRSFLGQLFSEAGYELVFADIDLALIERLNAAGAYPVLIKESGREDQLLEVAPVRAVDSRDTARLITEIKAAAYIVTSVGKNALPHIFPALVEGIEERREAVDIIIAENLHGGAAFFAEQILGLSPNPRLLERVGLVETSIGKMVPIMRAEDLARDPLQLFAEAYNELIVDRDAFKTALPPLATLKAVSPIAAYVDRKLYIHNLGHAASAYLGYRADPGAEYIWQCLDNEQTRTAVRGAMREAATALQREYPGSFGMEELEEHIEDLLGRFRNRKLMDTVFRVGRDLKRKLAPGDRLLGARDLIQKHGLPSENLDRVISAALSFAKGDEKGELFPGDREFAAARRLLGELKKRGFSVLT